MADMQGSWKLLSVQSGEGDVISGTVIDVRETGVTLDLGYYAPAVIKTET
mgnify:CR=1 FL=1